jgi:hypothetical protein
VVSASFAHRLNQEARTLPPDTHAFIQNARTKPFVTTTPGVAPAQRAQLHRDLQDASVHAFHTGLIIAAVLALLGGAAALVGIENPRRRVPCVECPGGAFAGASADVANATRRAQPEATPAGAPP